MVGVRGPSDASESQARHPVEVASIPGEQNPSVGKNDARDQAVPHSDAESLAFEGPANLGGSIGALRLEWQAWKRGEKLSDDRLLPRGPSAGEQLESSNGGGGELSVVELEGDSLGGGLVTLQEIDQHIRIGDHHRQDALISPVTARRPLASLESSAPRSVSARLRTAPCPVWALRNASRASAIR